MVSALFDFHPATHHLLRPSDPKEPPLCFPHFEKQKWGKGNLVDAGEGSRNHLDLSGFGPSSNHLPSPHHLRTMDEILSEPQNDTDLADYADWEPRWGRPVCLPSLVSV